MQLYFNFEMWKRELPVTAIPGVKALNCSQEQVHREDGKRSEKKKAFKIAPNQIKLMHVN